MENDSGKRIKIEVVGLIFYIYELHNFLYHQQTSMYDGSFEIALLKMVLLLFALPVLYFFRVANFFGWGGALSFFFSGAVDDSAFFQVKLFYRATYFLLSVLLFAEFLKYMHDYLVGII